MKIWLGAAAVTAAAMMPAVAQAQAPAKAAGDKTPAKICSDADASESVEAIAAACSAVIADSRYGARDHAIAYAQRGLAYVDLGKLDLAVADTAKATGLETGNNFVWAARGIVLASAGNFGDAKAA